MSLRLAGKCTKDDGPEGQAKDACSDGIAAASTTVVPTAIVPRFVVSLAAVLIPIFRETLPLIAGFSVGSWIP